MAAVAGVEVEGEEVFEGSIDWSGDFVLFLFLSSGLALQCSLLAFGIEFVMPLGARKDRPGALRLIISKSFDV